MKQKLLQKSLQLKKLFTKDQLISIYSEELSNILSKIDLSEIPDNYIELVKDNLKKNNTDIKKTLRKTVVQVRRACARGRLVSRWHTSGAGVLLRHLNYLPKQQAFGGRHGG